MASSDDLIVAKGDLTALRQKRDSEIGEASLRATRAYFDIIEAAQHFADDEEDIERLPTSKARRIARLARDCTLKEAPIGLVAALKYGEIYQRQQQQEREANTVNIANQQNIVVLPPRLPSDPPEACTYIDADLLKAEETQE